MNYRVDVSVEHIEDPGALRRRNLIRILADLYLNQADQEREESEPVMAYPIDQPLSAITLA